MHRAVRAFYELVKAGANPEKQTLLALLDTHWSPFGYGDRVYQEKMKRHGKELLEGFYDTGYDKRLIPKDLEASFSVRITPALMLGGRMDRVDQLPDGKIEIIDYKTGRAPATRNPGSDAQLSVYALAATEKGVYGKRSEDVIVSFYFFENQEKASAVRSQSQLDAMKAQVARAADNIAVSAFSPTPGKHCDFCEFRLICEAWK